MKEFGWTIEYVLSLTFPVFFDLFGLIRRIRMDAAIDEFYTPYGAVKFGGKCAEHLFKERGSVILKEETAVKNKEITPAMIRKANRRLRALMKQRQQELEKTAAKS